MSNLPAHVANRLPADTRPARGLVADARPVKPSLMVRIRRHFGPELADVLKAFGLALVVALVAGAIVQIVT